MGFASRCSDCPYNGKAITSEGPADADIVIVGEAPGSTELAVGRPFVGKAGELLNKALNRAGIERDRCLIINAMSCRPTDSPPAPAAIDACRERVAEELTAHPRKVVITFGNSALRSVLNDHSLKITMERGKAVPLGEYGQLVPTMHPAAILRGNQAEYPKMLADVQYAGQIAQTGEPKSPGEVEWTLVDTGHKLELLVNFWTRHSTPYVAADIETGYGGARTGGKILCLAVAWKKNRAAIITDEVIENNPQLMEELFISGPRFIWHNGKYDSEFFHSAGIHAPVDEDTMLMHYALDETRGGHDLATLAEDLLGADPEWKKVPKRYVKKGDIGYESVPREVLYPYAAKDVDATFQLFELFDAKLAKSKSLTKLYHHLLIPFSNFLQRVERHGVWIDRDYLAEFKKDVIQRVRDAEDRLAAEIAPFWDPEAYAAEVGAKKVPTEFNPRASGQVHWIIKQLGIDMPNTQEVTLRRADEGLGVAYSVWNKTGGERAARRMQQARGRGVDKSRPIENALIRAMLDHREATKQLTTYIQGIEERIEPDGRVHTTFKIHGTETGRLSSTNPNLQNIPIDKRVKRIFAAPPGYKIIEFDYSQVELRCLAHFSQDEFLQGVYRDGRNLHKEVAIALYGPDYTHQQYVRAKAVNFGIAYGRGADSLAQEFHISHEEAAEIRQKWFERSPQATEFINRCKASVRTGQTLISPFGRRRRFGLVTRELLNELENAASNFPMQSTASDLTLYSAMKIQDWFDRDSIDARVVLMVHDSIVVEVAEEQAESVAAAAQKIMERVPQKILNPVIPFDAGFGIGPNLGDAKD